MNTLPSTDRLRLVRTQTNKMKNTEKEWEEIEKHV